MNTYLSQHFEELAGKFYSRWHADTGTNPFARVCLVVGNPARADWLKERFLYPDGGSEDAATRGFKRGGDDRKVLANIDTKMLYPFVNDWLYAAIDGRDPRDRNPSTHPFSKDLLQWRIDDILAHNLTDYPELGTYLDTGKTENLPSRRFALSGKLASMFDDYQCHRPETLRDWENGNIADDPTSRWQACLWNALVAQGPDSYLKQFLSVAEGADLGEAFRHGIPRYASVHVFGIATMPRAYVQFFRQLDKVVPVSFYAFNPCQEFWLDDPNKGAARREVVDDLTRLMERRDDGELEGAETDVKALVEEISHPILGFLGNGGRGLLATLCDEFDGNLETLSFPSNEKPSLLHRLQKQIRERSSDSEKDQSVAADDASIQVHASFSPHREMEALKDSLLGWLRDDTERRPRDIVVLCADWANYAPQIAAVFGSGLEKGDIPYRMAGRVGKGGGPVAESFLSLLNILQGRFPVDEVMDLLATPAIAARFKLTGDDLQKLRDMARNANIHWGLDDDHVRETLGDAAKAQDGEPFPFTWRRGLDRLLLHALLGNIPDDTLASAGALAKLAPCGDAESERARLVGRLCDFIDRLASARQRVTKDEADSETWQNLLTGLVADFFQEDDESRPALAAIRLAILAATRRMRDAGDLAKQPLRRGFPVVAAAVAALVSAEVPERGRNGNSILFAPLKANLPAPRKLVWICGLNDKAFPRIVHRPAFDLLAREPRLLDPSPRDDDAYAFLEAICSARETLALSYVGRDIRSGDELPPSPILGNLLDYLREKFTREGAKWVEKKKQEVPPPFQSYVHRLQAFHKDYFTKKSSLPPSFSAGNYDAARKVYGQKEETVLPSAFTFLAPNEDTVSLDELCNVFTNPAKAILQKFGRFTDPKWDELSGDEALETKLKDELSIHALRELPDEKAAHIGALATEHGETTSPEEGVRHVQSVWKAPDVQAFRERVVPPPVNMPALDLLENLPTSSVHNVSCDVVLSGNDGETPRTIRVTGAMQAVECPSSDGVSVFCFPVLAKNAADRAPYILARYWIRHLVANASGLPLATVLLSGNGNNDKKAKTDIKLMQPLDPQVAASRLGKILEMLVLPFPGTIPYAVNASYELARRPNPSLRKIRELVKNGWISTIGRSSDQDEFGKFLFSNMPWDELSVADMQTISDYAHAFWSGYEFLPKVPKPNEDDPDAFPDGPPPQKPIGKKKSPKQSRRIEP